MSSTSVNTMVPLFDGRDYRLWSQKMEDYLKSQRLWGYAVGRNTRHVEAALTAGAKCCFLWKNLFLDMFCDFQRVFPMETQKVFLKEKSKKHMMCFLDISHR